MTTLFDQIIPNELKQEQTPAEQRLLAAAPVGELLDYRSGDSGKDDPENAAAWGPERTIRASFLYWLCIDPGATALIHAKGVQIAGIKISGLLNFEAATLPHPLVLLACSLPQGICLRNAKTRQLMFSGSHTGSLKADRVVVDGGMFLRQGFQAKGEVRLLSADIGGNLDCGGGHFSKGNGRHALSADGLSTKGSVFLSNGFEAEGEVRLSGADIGGNLDCGGGHFSNENGDALSADGLLTKGAVFLNNGFEAKGEVRLLGADIGGYLECGSGHFSKGNGRHALSADQLSIKGGIFLRNGFEAEGEVRLLGADIGGNLDCSGGHFSNENGDALSADGLLTKGAVFLSNGFEAKGEVRLLAVSANGPIICRKGSFKNSRGIALNLERGRGDGSLMLDEMTIDGTLNLGNAHVGDLVDNRESWPAKGHLVLEGFVYENLSGDQTPKSAKERLSWLELQPGTSSHPETYEQLGKVFRVMGRDSEAREILIAKHRAVRRCGGLSSWGKTWDWVLDKIIAYGYKPWKATIYIVLIVGLGWDIFSFADRHGIMSHPPDKPEEAQARPFHPFMYSLDTFLPVEGFHQKDLWFPNETIRPYGRWVQIYLWIHVALGWFFSTILIAGFTGLLHKE